MDHPGALAVIVITIVIFVVVMSAPTIEEK